MTYTAIWVTNSVDPDQTPRSAASDQGLHCLLQPVYPNTMQPRWPPLCMYRTDCCREVGCCCSYVKYILKTSLCETEEKWLLYREVAIVER